MSSAVESKSPQRRVSVAMATCIGGKYLRAQLESIAGQHNLPYEVVISDDHSTDDTLAVAKDFGSGPPFPVKIITDHTPLRGVIGDCFNAFAHCDSDIIAYCYLDDVWHSYKLSECLSPFSDPKVSLVIHRSRVVDGELKDLGFSRPVMTVDQIIPYPD